MWPASKELRHAVELEALRTELRDALAGLEAMHPCLGAPWKKRELLPYLDRARAAVARFGEER